MAEKKDFEAAEAAVRAREHVGEFITGWIPGAPTDLVGWAERRKAGLMGTAKSTHYTPPFRPFDLLDGPNEPLVILENSSHRIGVEAVVGVQDSFRRYVDADMIYFQFCGLTKLETECGIYEMRPGEVVVIPAGVAHRSSGERDSLRYFCLSQEPVEYLMDEAQYNEYTEFDVFRSGGPDWRAGGTTTAPTERVLERMYFWDDGPEDSTVAERDYDQLVGVASTGPGETESLVRKVRAFDHFTGISGTDGPDAGTQVLLEAKHLRIRTYNIVGEQFAFHRPLKSVELRIQFRGDALDLSEFENVEVSPGKVTLIPLGIAHSVISVPEDDKDFLRLNFYSRLPWRVTADVRRHSSDSHFEVSAKLRESS